MGGRERRECQYFSREIKRGIRLLTMIGLEQHMSLSE